MAVLTKEALRKAIEKDCLVSPILERDQIGDGSIDLRLGTEFLVMRRTERTAIDPERTTAGEIQGIQRRQRVAFGGLFVLHPADLVLAATFEFIRLPGHLSALVVSRSSFGRIGLLVATAVYIHPLWRGYLTLELYNYGNIPIKLAAGSPIGQLVVFKAERLRQPDDYFLMPQIPIGPSYSEMAQWADWEKLTRLRDLEEKPMETRRSMLRKGQGRRNQ